MAHSFVDQSDSALAQTSSLLQICCFKKLYVLVEVSVSTDLPCSIAKSATFRSDPHISRVKQFCRDREKSTDLLKKSN